MTIEARVRELDLRHQSLKATIAREAKSVSVDPLYLKELKRKKLRIKEELARIKEQIRPKSELETLQ